jgi:hypothetical protein
VKITAIFVLSFIINLLKVKIIQASRIYLPIAQGEERHPPKRSGGDRADNPISAQKNNKKKPQQKIAGAFVLCTKIIDFES